MIQTTDWQDVSAPSLADFEAMTAAAWRRLPEAFREKAGDVLIRVEDFATPDVLQALGIDNPIELTGLYHGVSLNRKSELDVPREPDMVFLYRRPILDEWADGGETLGDLVTHILVHEIGHHFGFSDADMVEIEIAAGA